MDFLQKSQSFSHPRYTDRPLPPYRHLPGKTPHPERSPEGHMYGRKEAVLPFDPERWRENELYLWGVDLFNHGYWWEAHTAWETLWKATRRDDLPGVFLQGLIQISAALLKRRAGQPGGARRLAERGLRKLRRVASRTGERRYMGVELELLADRAESYLTSEKSSGRPPLLPLA